MIRSTTPKSFSSTSRRSYIGRGIPKRSNSMDIDSGGLIMPDSFQIGNYVYTENKQDGLSGRYALREDLYPEQSIEPFPASLEFRIVDDDSNVGPGAKRSSIRVDSVGFLDTQGNSTYRVRAEMLLFSRGDIDEYCYGTSRVGAFLKDRELNSIPAMSKEQLEKILETMAPLVTPFIKADHILKAAMPTQFTEFNTYLKENGY